MKATATSASASLSMHVPSSSVPASGPGPVDAAQLAWFRTDLRPHFDDWVITPIRNLVYEPSALYGFIFMTCTIDYLAGFWWGEETKREVGKAYAGFINTYFPPNTYDAYGLYDSLRNGLLHMFTIKGRKYALTHNHPELHLVVSSGQIVLNAGDFFDDLVTAKEKYFDAVETDADLLKKAVTRYQRDGFLGLVPITAP